MGRNGTPTDSVRVTNWFIVPDNQLDFVQFTDQTLTSAQINALFGSGLMSATESVAPPQRFSDRWDRSLALFVDAMNHFGRRQEFVVDHNDGADRDLHLDWLTTGRTDLEMGPRQQGGGGHGGRRQLV